MTYASASLVDPPMASPVTASMMWIEATALGTVAGIVAVIAVAAVGLMLLSGRIDLRRGVTVILGCFLIFGASSTAGQFTGSNGAVRSPAVPAVDREPIPVARPSPPASYDPYAGAAVPSS